MVRVKFPDTSLSGNFYEGRYYNLGLEYEVDKKEAEMLCSHGWELVDGPIEKVLKKKK